MASSLPNVTLVSPADGNVSYSNNTTFICNASDDENVFRIAFYNNIAGSFSLNSTKRIMELEKDANTTMLCHFNNTYTCEDGEEGTNTSTSFELSKFLEGVLINDSDTLKYSTLSNIDIRKGTIEFWIKVGFNTSSGAFWLFDTGTGDFNFIDMYVSNGIINFEFIDNFGSVSTADRSISSWGLGEWHHVAAVWNTNTPLPGGGMINLFLDGSDESVTKSTEFDTAGNIDPFMYIGSRTTGSNKANSIFDELQISNISRTANEINASYMKGVGNHSTEEVNFTVTGISDGTYIWNCLVYDNESQISWGTNNYTFSIDIASPPSVNLLSFLPNSTDDIDPGVTINITANITDPSNVSTTILQYKYDVGWINVTMSRSGDMWNASFTTISSERVYYYHIFTNDTKGNSNTTQSSTLNITWDYSWTRNPSTVTAYGLINSISEVGILAINNTGDDTLIITLSDNWPIVDVYYNTTEQFSLSAKNVLYVNVTAKFASTDSSSTMTINMSAIPSAPGKTASPVSTATMVTMNSYSGGAYLDVNIVSLPTYVSQSQININLTATIRNIGNETAANVWFNWSLPSGWTNTSGSANTSLGNISSQSSANISNITVRIDPTAQSGIVTVCIIASGSVNNSVCQNVQVSCTNSDGVCGAGCTYINDNDCSIPQTGGGGSGASGSISVSGIGSSTHKIGIITPGKIDVYRGNKISFNVSVRNIGKNSILKNIDASITGYHQTQTKITGMPSILQVNQEEKFLIEFYVPEYLHYGPYNITIKTTADAFVANTSKNGTHVEGTAPLVLFVHSAYENATLEIFRNAQKELASMILDNLNTKQVSQLLEESKNALDNYDYDRVKELSEEAIKIAVTARTAQSSLANISSTLEEASRYKIETPETKKMYSLAAMAFARGDYEKSAERIQNAFAAGGIEIGSKIQTARILEQNQLLIAGVAAGMIIFILILRYIILLRLTMLHITRLEKEKQAIRTILKDLQIRAFEKQEINRVEYQESVNAYQRRLAHINAEEPRLIIRKNRMMRILGHRHDFEKQHLQLIQLMHETQKKRFELGKIGKSEYDELMKELQKELAEVENKMEKKKGRPVLPAIIIIFFVLLSSTALAINETDTDYSRTQAIKSINEAEKIVSERATLGLPATRMNDTLREAKILFDRGAYLGATSAANYVSTLNTLALNIDVLVDKFEERLYETEQSGIDIHTAKELFDNGIESLKAERYEEAENLMKNALNMIDEMEAEHSLQEALKKSQKENIIEFASSNRYYIIASAVIFSAFIIFFFEFTKPLRKRGKLNSLMKEKSALETTLRHLQKKYFEDGTISKRAYRLSAGMYKNKLMKIRKEMEMLKKK